MATLHNIIKKIIRETVTKTPRHHAFERLNNVYQAKKSITGKDLEIVGKQINPKAELNFYNNFYFHGVSFPTRKGDITIFFPDKREHTPSNILVETPISITLGETRFFLRESTRIVDIYGRKLEKYTPYNQRMYRTSPIGSK